MAFELIQEGDRRLGIVRGIKINEWTITSKSAPICNSAEIDSFQKEYGIPPPEMIFGNNRVAISKGGMEYFWTAFDALALVDTSESSSTRVKVAYATEWTRNSNHQNVKDVVKPYDWTYSTNYKGTSNQADWERVDEPVINVDRLKQREQIVFYDENILYEDELADNGTAMLSVRLRVMPTCFLVLQRFFLRVDNVLFGINDTRIYHEFGSPFLMREFTSKQASYQSIRQKIDGNVDISLLNDANWVASMIPEDHQLLERHRLRV
ncbi:TIP41-domain-containing protein [Hesseltinella vesiculosa]|uniref:TIP41-domain-containing protein n=1 Tax=Hesseltinella vesiculosa TaxID=101127 RepID=A0A1X2GEQ9_9FUNG|nr:TIP41-domain-containing protein [Hesseltinella vesiculosa]